MAPCRYACAADALVAARNDALSAAMALRYAVVVSTDVEAPVAAGAMDEDEDGRVRAKRLRMMATIAITSVMRQSVYKNRSRGGGLRLVPDVVERMVASRPSEPGGTAARLAAGSCVGCGSVMRLEYDALVMPPNGRRAAVVLAGSTE